MQQSDRTERAFDALDSLADAPADPELRALKVALFIEDVFGVTFEDDEINESLLSGREELLAALRAKL